MHNNDIDKFFVMLNGISDYYGKQISKGVMRLYWEGLRQYDFEAVEKAFWTHTQNPDTGQFMPKIADVAKYLKGRTVDQASQAWSKVDKAIRMVGTYQDVVFDDPIIHRVIEDMGGWISFGNKREDEWPFVQNQFENRYRGFVMREEIPEHQARLIGIANAQNAQHGFPLNVPVLVGDKGKAEAILRSGSNHVALEFQSAASNLKYLQ
jgi:hypothetical protein